MPTPGAQTLTGKLKTRRFAELNGVFKLSLLPLAANNILQQKLMSAIGVRYRNGCDESGQTRSVRKIGTTRRSVSGARAFRDQTSIAFESTLERDFLIRNGFFLDVLDIISQPVEVPFVGLDGRAYTYTPDFLVYYRLGNRPYGTYPKPMLIEVKPEDKWRKNWRIWLPKWKAAWRYAQDQGWCFHIHDESRIRDNVYENIRFVERYQRTQCSEEESDWIIENVREMGFATVDYLLSRHFGGHYRNQGYRHIWHLIAASRLDCDMSRPLNDMTEVWVPMYE